MTAPYDALAERRAQTVRLHNASTACVRGCEAFLHDAFDIVLAEDVPEELEDLARRAEQRLRDRRTS